MSKELKTLGKTSEEIQDQRLASYCKNNPEISKRTANKRIKEYWADMEAKVQKQKTSIASSTSECKQSDQEMSFADMGKEVTQTNEAGNGKQDVQNHLNI